MHQARSHSLHHVLLLGHRGLSHKLVVDLLHDGCKGRILVPALNGHSLIFNGYGIKSSVCHRRHHVNLRRHLRELRRQSDLDVEGCWRDRKLERHSVLSVLGSLSVHDGLRVHLTKLVELDVGHGGIVGLHLLTSHLLGGSLASHHIVLALLIHIVSLLVKS